MRFYEVVARGRSTTGQVVSSYWYRDIAEGLPSSADLVKVADVWQADFQPKLRAIHTTHYTLDEVAVYGYDGSWNRSPYLPLLRAVNLAGQLATAEILPYAAVIFSLKVEPVESSPKTDPRTGAPVERPVRRGYIAFGPLGEGYIDNAGLVTAAFSGLAAVVAYRDQLKAELFNAGYMVTPLQPIRVGKPRDGMVRKGYGLVKDAVLRQYGSTRRSRMAGRGA